MHVIPKDAIRIQQVEFLTAMAMARYGSDAIREAKHRQATTLAADIMDGNMQQVTDTRYGMEIRTNLYVFTEEQLKELTMNIEKAIKTGSTVTL